VQLSAPFLVFGLLFNVALGLLARLMPQMQVFFVAMPLLIMAGLVIFVIVVGTMMSTYLVYVEDVLHQLAPHI
jgi:flagellar biosynthetic protein FliR